MVIIPATGVKNRLTISNDRTTLKIVKDIADHQKNQLIAFAEYCKEQFVTVDGVWRAEIEFRLDGVQYIIAIFRNGTKTRRYEVIV
jgi:hypothetical protein